MAKSAFFGLFQTHPYMVAWSSVNENGHTVIYFLVQSRHGFSKRLRSMDVGASSIIHGPFGGEQSLRGFEKVLLLSSGIGIASQLLHIRDLLRAHNGRTDRVRRISIAWVVENESEQFFEVLKSLIS